jgi:ATP-dependent Clp protease ATP-binding subunit ClpX
MPSLRKGPDTVEIDTTNILFIIGGAFIGLDSIIKKRVQGTNMGFNATVTHDVDTALALVNPDDLVRYGIIPEFVGRFPSVITLHNLTKTQLITVLTTVKNNLLAQYKWLFDQDGIELEFDTDSLDLIVDRTMQNKTGARGLHSELERVLMPHMYNLPTYKTRNQLRVEIDKIQVNTPIKLLKENE